MVSSVKLCYARFNILGFTLAQQTNTMAQIVKAVRMIVGRDKLNAPTRKQPKVVVGEIEIEDDAPKRKPSLEEIDALEVITLPYIVLKNN